MSLKSSATTEGTRLGAVEAIGVFLVPIIVVWSGLYQLHPRVGWVDPGLYISNFFNLPKNMAWFGSDPVGANYHFSRLPFVLPGYAIYRVLEPVRAQAVLVIGFYALGLAALFSVARTLVSSVGGRVAFVWIVALNPLWIATFVDGYVDGPAMTFALFSYAALASAKPRLLGRSRAFWVGVAIALAMSTQPFAGGIAAVVAFVFSSRDAVTWREALRFLARAAAGVLCAVVALGALGAVFGVPFWYLLSSADFLHRVSGGVLAQYLVPTDRWIENATRIALWPLVFLMLVRVSWRRTSPRPAVHVALLDAVFIWTIVFLIADFATHHFFTQFRYYASYLWLSLVPALAVLIDDVTAERTTVAAAVPAAALAIGIAMPLCVQWGLFGDAPMSAGVFAWAAIAAPGIVGFHAEWTGERTLGFVGIALSLAVAGTSNVDTAAIFATSTGPDHRSASMAVAEVHKALAKTGLAERRVLTWFNRDAFTSATGGESVYKMDFAGQTYRYNLLDTIAASFGWSQTAFNFSMPDVDDMWQYQFAQFSQRGVPTAIVVLCAHPDECRIGERTLSEQGIFFDEVAVRRVELPRVPPFSFALLDIDPSSTFPQHP